MVAGRRGVKNMGGVYKPGDNHHPSLYTLSSIWCLDCLVFGVLFVCVPESVPDVGTCEWGRDCSPGPCERGGGCSPGTC